MPQSATEDKDPLLASELDTLAGMPVFGGVSSDALEFLLRRVERVQIPRGGYYFREGEPGGAMYVLLRGRVELSRGLEDCCEVLGRLGPGDCFGEMALLDLYPRSASVKTLEDSAALSITHGLLYELYGQSPEPFTIMMMNLARELSRRLRSANQRLANAYGGWAVAFERKDGSRGMPYI